MTAFTMTKLVVGDLEQAKAFYGAVCGLSEAARFSGAVDGRSMTEVILGGGAPGAATLVLFAFHGAPAPPAGECVLVFETDDIAAFLARAAAAGAEITQPATALPDLGLTYAFVRDPEGHTVEAIERAAAAAS